MSKKLFDWKITKSIHLNLAPEECANASTCMQAPCIHGYGWPSGSHLRRRLSVLSIEIHLVFIKAHFTLLGVLRCKLYYAILVVKMCHFDGFWRWFPSTRNGVWYTVLIGRRSSSSWFSLGYSHHQSTITSQTTPVWSFYPSPLCINSKTQFRSGVDPCAIQSWAVG